MHDVVVLMPKIVKWINKSLSIYANSSREEVGSKTEELYNDFKSGVVLACILKLYAEESH